MLEKVKTNNITVVQKGTDIAFSYTFEKEEHFAKAIGRVELKDDPEWSYNKRSGTVTYTAKITEPTCLGEIAAQFEELVK
jgi:hypothetical protein